MNTSKKDILRLLDANINRAVEGIRVLEETARMIFNDERLTRSLKDIRHALVNVVRSEKGLAQFLFASRGSEHDVLRSGETISERSRPDITSVVHANAGRAQEALRTLEEYGKLLYPHLSERFKEIRFQLYDIEKSFVLLLRTSELVNKDRMGIYIVIDRDALAGLELIECTRTLIEEGAGTIAYSDRNSGDSEFLKHAEHVLDACREKNVTAIICDRLDCAMILEADGVLVDCSGISVKECRKIAGPDFVVGYSQTLKSRRNFTIPQEADYVIAESNLSLSQDNKELLSQLKKAVSVSQIPVVLMGEFAMDITRKVLDFGVTGIAFTPQAEKFKQTLRKVKALRKILHSF